ncbi:hypothetical protein NCAS_0A08180 [Naumovozyma castellii]|uniref:Uncharacterized protein n=1 Tax=Naumovozyma castellii TaxID=27288 RepID=G0V7C8_NAUCA|nr:hypothetical protein NCAS_0A08180 [Naumovozyma castellii CBS 4309]CCC67376.1 hypothetical protein NCAS_0A08180 [Naumovozyma castellii CBS 4309]
MYSSTFSLIILLACALFTSVTSAQDGEEPQPWVRTVYSTVVEIITPTVIAGVTFSGKPLHETREPLDPWISLNKAGKPKTINPELKKGRVHNPSPEYSTFFQSAVVKETTLPNGEKFEDEEYVEEDKTYISLNPIIRCTPERFFNKMAGYNDDTSEPFCTPHENVKWVVGSTYFVTWYTRSFPDIIKVRIHLSFVKESMEEIGMYKRDDTDKQPPQLLFFSSEWIDNFNGIYPITVDEDWMMDKYERKIMVSIQPSDIKDEEFDPFDNGITLHLKVPTKIYKNTKQYWEKEEQGIRDDRWLRVAITVPIIILFVCLIVYVSITLGNRRINIAAVSNRVSAQKHRVLGKVKDIKRYKHFKNHPYSELPRKTDKQH